MSEQRRPLRERKKATAMRQIQTTAMRLFQRRGFSAVTVEEIADASDTSPSTIYRYFGTKEEIVMRDEYDDDLRVALALNLQNATVPVLDAVRTAVAAVADRHFVHDRQLALARTELWLKTPSIQAATHRVLTEAAEEGARLLNEYRGLPLDQARVIATAIIHVLHISVLNWYRAGAEKPWQGYAEEAITLLEHGL